VDDEAEQNHRRLRLRKRALNSLREMVELVDEEDNEEEDEEEESESDYVDGDGGAFFGDFGGGWGSSKGHNLALDTNDRTMGRFLLTGSANSDRRASEKR
jgi:hypothetical protein